MSASANDPRSLDRIRYHYTVERELATRLRLSAPEGRAKVYSAVYDELYRRVPDHPQWTFLSNPTRVRARARAAFAFVGRFLSRGATMLEVGPGDCELARLAAAKADQVYAVDVSEEIASRTDLPGNVQVLLSGGVDIPLPDDCVDLAYSDQLLEHLHPDDAMPHLQTVYRVLKPGGAYVLITPNRLYGPADVSGRFDLVATGLHLREYTGAELRRMLAQVGFSSVAGYVGGLGHFTRMPTALQAGLELGCGALPGRLRQRVARLAPLRRLLALRLVARK